MISHKIKIYKIIDNTNGNVYIGSTQKQLRKILTGHEYEYNQKNKKGCVSRLIIKNDDYRIVLIEETYDKTRKRFWILNTECINIQIPGRTNKEWREDNKDNIKIQEAAKYLKNLKQYNQFRNTWGGDPRNNNNLLKIDPNLFTF